MPYSDMTLPELEAYRSPERVPDDFDDRWQASLAQSRAKGGDVSATPVPSRLATLDAWDVTFSGFGGDPIKAWLLRPRGVDGELPVVIEYQGYGGGRGLVHERLMWAAAGYAYLIMDTRGQGSAWGNGGDTADASGGGEGAAPALPGFMTRGIGSFDSYYYRRVFIDAARCIDAARALPGIDSARVGVFGASQGGGIAIAAAGLVPDISAALVDVPFLCDIPRGIAIAEQDPYQEVARYLAVHRGRVDEVVRTLSYVDGVHHAARATAPTLFSVGLRDDVCPPSTGYAAYHAWAGPKRIVSYPFNGHEGGQAHHDARKLDFLADLWG